jgi:hypothetical protein
MIASRFITNKQEIEHELKIGVWRDPKRMQYLLAKLQQIERDISSMGFSKEEAEKKRFCVWRNEIHNIKKLSDSAAELDERQ